MRNTSTVLVNLVAIAAGFVIVIAAIYVWLLPAFFNGYKTYSFLVIGVVGSAALSGYHCFRNDASEFIFDKLLLSSVCAVVVAALVAFLSLAIIVSVRGS